MKTPAAVAALAVILTVPLFGQSKVPPDLQKAMTDRAAALSASDATNWARLTADSFTVVSSDGTVQTKAERVAALKAGRPAGPGTVQHETVQLFGNTAVDRFESNSGRFTFVWVKERAGWRVASAQVTPMMADSATLWRTIGATNASFSQSFMKGDIDALASVYADDAVLMLSNAPAMEGSAAIKQGFTQFLATATVPNVKLTTSDIIILPYGAIERGVYEMTIRPKAPGSAEMVDKGKYITVWLQQDDGSWKISRDISNSDAMAAK